MLNRELTLRDAAKLFDVQPDLVKKWVRLFSEFMTPTATRLGSTRIFTQVDVQVLALVYEMRDCECEESDEDYSDIFFALNSGDHFDERFRQLSFFNTPIFQTPPEDLDETWTHGILIGGMGSMTLADGCDIAQSFRRAADILVIEALDSQVPYTLTYPILYNYRHAIELYLKVATGSEERTHDLAYLVEKLKQQHGTGISRWAEIFFEQLQDLDKKSTTFRYGEHLPCDEIWIDLRQLKEIIHILSSELEKIIGSKFK